MKRHLLFLLLATACNSAPGLPERLSGEKNEVPGNALGQRLMAAEKPVRDAPHVTLQERADFAAELARAVRADKLGYDPAGYDPAGDTTVTDASQAGKSLDSAYTVVAAPDRERFTRRVNEHLNSGYFLRGPMRTERTGPAAFLYLQELVRHRKAGVE